MQAGTPGGGRSARGFGDTTVLLQRTTVVRPHTHAADEPRGPLGLHAGEGRLALGLGLSLPTGTPERPQFFGLLPNATLQTGTGTFDPLVTAVYNQSLNGGSVFAGMSAKTGGGENRFDQRIGTSILSQAGAILPLHDRVDGTAKVSFLWAAADEVAGTKLFASGGSRAALVPGLRWKITEELDVQAFAEIPVWRNLRTQTLESSVRWILGLTWSR